MHLSFRDPLIRLFLDRLRATAYPLGGSFRCPESSLRPTCKIAVITTNSRSPLIREIILRTDRSRTCDFLSIGESLKKGRWAGDSFVCRPTPGLSWDGHGHASELFRR